MSTEQVSNNDNDEQQTATVLEETTTIPWYMDWKNWLKIVIILIIVTFIVLAIIYNQTTGEILTSFLQWMQDNAAAGSFAFIGIYWFCTVLFIPGSLLTLGAGAVFRVVAGPVTSLYQHLTMYNTHSIVYKQAAGVFLATLIVLCGAGLGASTAFLLGRFVFREKVASYKTKYEKFDIIDKVVEQQGLKVTILLRLSPVIPFSVFNYAMGLTGVSFKNYNIAHVGMIPGTLAYCFIGGTLGAIGETAGAGFGNPLVLTLTIVGTVLALVGMVYISFVAKKEFARIAEQQQQLEMGGDKKENDETTIPISSAPQEEENEEVNAGNEETTKNENEDEDSKSLSVGN